MSKAGAATLNQQATEPDRELTVISNNRGVTDNELLRLRKLAPSLDKPIAANNYGRSGSVLLQTLLDWHPNTISTPGIYASRLYYFYEQHSRLPKEQLIDKFMHEFELLFDPRRPCLAYSTAPNAGEYSGFTRLGPSREGSYLIDQQLFRQCLSATLADYENVPRKLFFQAVHVAYRYALGQPGEIDTNTRIVFPLHTPIPSKFTRQFAEDFPQAKYILMVRTPIDTTASMVRHLNGTGEILFFLYGFLYQSLFGGVASAPSAAGTTRAVRLEDLHRTPQKTLERLCEWLELPWHENLMKSTVHGQEWWGGNDSLGVNGFSEAVVAKRHEREMPEIDRFRLNVLLAPKCRRWGYDVCPADTSFARKLIVLLLLVMPFTMEKQFLAKERLNRMKGNATKRSMVSPLVYLVWFSWFGTFCRYLEIRLRLLKAWLATFAQSTREVQLL